LDTVQHGILRRNAWRLIPILTLAYVVNYLDRTNLAFAGLTMKEDIGLTATQFGYGAGVLFAGYCVFEIPSNLALYRFGARLWIARIMITWGVISAAMAFVTGPYDFYLVRFLLGVAEAGFFPGVTYYLAAWFPPQYRARILAWFLVGIPVSSLIGAPLSGLLLEMDGIAGLKGWQWLFVAEGIPAVALGLIVARMLADRPETASWLSADEKQILSRMLAEERRERARTDLLAALRDPRVLICALVQFGFTLGSYGVGIWLPQIIKGHALSNFTVTMLSAVPYVFASIAMIIWAAGVDRSGRKIVNLTLACLLAAVGLVGSVLSGALAPALVGLTVALIGVTSARAIFWTIPTRFLTGVGAAGGLAFINSIGTLGGFAGPYLMGFLKDQTGTFEAGLIAMAALLALTTLLAWSLRRVIKEE
jgi:ACS family tartrate transporter-like MFS transporter